jgi:hypothetical protein
LVRSSAPVVAADGDDAGGVVDELDDRRPAAGIAGGGDDAGGLVEEHVGELLPGDRLAVEAYVVALGDEGVELAGLAVDGDPPGLDQLVGAAAGRHPGARDPGVQPHARSLVPAGRRRTGELGVRQSTSIALDSPGCGECCSCAPGD